MTMKFSASSHSFYDPKYTSSFPADAVDVSDTEYASIQSVLAAGGSVKADSMGNPVATPPQSATLAEIQAQQIAVITQACAAAITGGFTSSALGAAHTYPSGLTDQANLAANVVSSLLPGLPSTWTTPQLCCDANGVWAYVAHTAAQIQQVGSDGKAAILASLTKKANLQAEIEAATTVSAVQAIVW